MKKLSLLDNSNMLTFQVTLAVPNLRNLGNVLSNQETSKDDNSSPVIDMKVSRY